MKRSFEPAFREIQRVQVFAEASQAIITGGPNDPNKGFEHISTGLAQKMMRGCSPLSHRGFRPNDGASAQIDVGRFPVRRFIHPRRFMRPWVTGEGKIERAKRITPVICGFISIVHVARQRSAVIASGMQSLVDRLSVNENLFSLPICFA
jgi:hypothetical protein